MDFFLLVTLAFCFAGGSDSHNQIVFKAYRGPKAAAAAYDKALDLCQDPEQKPYGTRLFRIEFIPKKTRSTFLHKYCKQDPTRWSCMPYVKITEVSARPTNEFEIVDSTNNSRIPLRVSP